MLQHVAFSGAQIPRDVRPTSPEFPLPVYLLPAPGGSTEATLIEIDLVVASTTVPQPLSATDLFVDEVSVKAKTENATLLKIGYHSANATQLWDLLPTEWISRKAPPGKKINLAKIYVDVGSSGDGVVVHATA